MILTVGGVARRDLTLLSEAGSMKHVLHLTSTTAKSSLASTKPESDQGANFSPFALNRLSEAETANSSDICMESVLRSQKEFTLMPFIHSKINKNEIKINKFSTAAHRKAAMSGWVILRDSENKL